jgi:hypothetical protein
VATAVAHALPTDAIPGWNDHANCVTTGHIGRGDDAAVRLFRAHPLRKGDYLTDRRRLYRVLDIVPAKFNRRAAILEDCHSLDATLFRPRQLRRMQLQLVQPALVTSS